MEESLKSLLDISKEYHSYLHTLSNEETASSTDGKWSINEEIIHLILSISPLNKALKMSKFQLKVLFGSAKGGPRSYDEIEQLYRAKLEEGAKAPSSYVPKENKFASNKELFDKWLSKTEEFEKLLSKWRRSDLDKVVLPHPLLGKLAISELVHFTLLHSRMHLQKTKKS
jgi:hypothetical protein